MKLFILLLALATVSYATTHGLKAHLGLKNRVHQDNEEALITGGPFSVLPEDLTVEQEPVVEQAIIEEPPQIYYSAPYVDDEEAYIETYVQPNTDIAYTTSTYQEIAPVQEEYVIEIEAEPEAPIAVPISIPITGGWTDIDPSAVDTDADLRALVELGVATSLDVGSKDGKVPAGIEYHLSKVSSIKSQVVAGTNYQISVELTDGGDRRIFADFTIFDQPWSQTREVKSLCIRVGRYVSI